MTRNFTSGAELHSWYIEALSHRGSLLVHRKSLIYIRSVCSLASHHSQSWLALLLKRWLLIIDLQAHPSSVCNLSHIIKLSAYWRVRVLDARCLGNSELWGKLALPASTIGTLCSWTFPCSVAENRSVFSDPICLFLSFLI